MAPPVTGWRRGTKVAHQIQLLMSTAEMPAWLTKPAS
jgi:hypothetical protein